MKERGAKSSMRLCIKGFSREETSLVRIMVVISFLDDVYDFGCLYGWKLIMQPAARGRAGVDSV
jgi:hypothetical protein